MRFQLVRRWVLLPVCCVTILLLWTLIRIRTPPDGLSESTTGWAMPPESGPHGEFSCQLREKIADVLHQGLARADKDDVPLNRGDLSAWQDLYDQTGGASSWRYCTEHRQNPCACDWTVRRQAERHDLGPWAQAESRIPPVSCHAVESRSGKVERRIVSLHLRDNGLRGQVPMSFSHLSLLQMLELSGSFHAREGLSGSLNWLCHLPRLFNVVLENQYFTGNIPDCISELPGLQVLWLNSNLLQGPVPHSLGALVQLETVQMYEMMTYIDPPISAQPCALLMRVIDDGPDEDTPRHHRCTPGGLSGPLPDLSRLVHLRVLWLDGNDLTGTLPSWIGDLASLRSLDLFENKFTGKLPTSLGKLEHLVQLKLQRLELTCTSDELVDIVSSHPRLRMLGVAGIKTLGPSPRLARFCHETESCMIEVEKLDLPTP